MGEGEALNDFKQKVIERYDPEKIILFGSRARGDNFRDSDVDILIISEKFNGIPFRKRMIDMQFLWEGAELLEAFCYTPREFGEKKDNSTVVRKAIKEGIELT